MENFISHEIVHQCSGGGEQTRALVSIGTLNLHCCSTGRDRQECNYCPVLWDSTNAGKWVTIQEMFYDDRFITGLSHCAPPVGVFYSVIFKMHVGLVQVLLYCPAQRPFKEGSGPL